MCEITHHYHVSQAKRYIRKLQFARAFRLNLDIQVALARRSCRLTTLLFPPADEPATDVDQSPANYNSLV